MAKYNEFTGILNETLDSFFLNMLSKKSLYKS